MAQNKTNVLTSHVPLPLAEKVDQEEERSRLTREALADVEPPTRSSSTMRCKHGLIASELW